MDCDELDCFLDAYLDGELELSRQRDLEHHLSRCPTCHSLAEECRQTREGRARRGVEATCSVVACFIAARVAAGCVVTDGRVVAGCVAVFMETPDERRRLEGSLSRGHGQAYSLVKVGILRLLRSE